MTFVHFNNNQIGEAGSQKKIPRPHMQWGEQLVDLNHVLFSHTKASQLWMIDYD